MKENCFSYLKTLSDTALALCEAIAKKDLKKIDEYMDRSEQARQTSLTFSFKQFVTPVDREDIAYLALLLHRLNSDLFYLAKLSEVFSHKKDLSPLISPTVAVCKRNSLYLNWELSKKIDEEKDIYTHLPIEALENVSYIVLENYADSRLLEAFEHCRRSAVEIHDYIVRTIVKNT